MGAFRGTQPNKRSGGSGTVLGRQRKDARYSVIALLSLKLYAFFARSFGGYLTSGSAMSRLCSFCVPHGSRSTTASMIQYIVQYQIVAPRQNGALEAACRNRLPRWFRPGSRPGSKKGGRPALATLPLRPNSAVHAPSTLSRRLKLFRHRWDSLYRQIWHPRNAALPPDPSSKQLEVQGDRSWAPAWRTTCFSLSPHNSLSSIVVGTGRANSSWLLPRPEPTLPAK